jgi:hypothetical protein
MDLKSIFQRNGADETRVPELEVQGDRLRVEGTDPEIGEQEDSRGGDQKTRDIRLPKTKWF